MKLAVVIPCFREKAHILDVLERIGPEVDHILVVDDACPDGTGAFVRESCRDPRVEVLVHERNQGVGGATLTGYQRALDLGAEAMVKLDGDGQMDPALIGAIAAPVLKGRADYAKGNRFHDLAGLEQMPGYRIFGNLALSFATKLSSGYWDVFDPTNGFTAIHAAAARRLPFDKISRSYFFESDMLFRLYLARAVVEDVPMAARYGTETSHIRLGRTLAEFAAKHVRNIMKRIFYSYFLRDFNIASIELVLGKLLFLFGLAYGGFRWWQSEATGIPATAGTVLLAGLPVILGTQMLLGFLDYDTRNIPRRPLQSL
ncbi:MAG: glycosyltransferase family 2 protein [Magnetospirillum sp. WYHS-4]